MHQLSSFRVLLAALALVWGFAVGCSDDSTSSDTGTDTGQDMVGDQGDVAPDVEEDVVDPEVQACRAAIAARAAEVSDDLPWSIDDATEMTSPSGTDQSLEADYAGSYRDDIANHPGCAPRTEYGANVEVFVTNNELDVCGDTTTTDCVPAGTPASITGFDCAAKEYAQDDPDTTKPIVILVHGNSSSVTSFEEWFNAAVAGTTLSNLAGFTFTADNTLRPQLATRLLDEGYEVMAFDARTDRVATLGDWDADNATGNPFLNIDHGWGVPMLMDFLRAAMTENSDRMFAIVGHSYGVTEVRDALRRLYIEWRDEEAGAVNPFAQLTDVILASGANHGVSTSAVFCPTWTHMRGTVACEMGDRDTYTPTYFSNPLNGPSDLFVAPCADGSYAYGETDRCEGNVVDYTTITMEDLSDGQLQDEFVSEESSALDLEPCVNNVLIGLDDFDSSGFFFDNLNGFLANHFGSIRSDDGIQTILDALAD